MSKSGIPNFIKRLMMKIMPQPTYLGLVKGPKNQSQKEKR